MKRIISIIIMFVLILQGIQVLAVETLPTDLISLHVGSPLTLYKGEIKTLDSDNPNVVPIIHKDRTLIPLRAISEQFGADVSYNNKDRIASIIFDGKTYDFPIDKNYYTVKELGKASKKVEFDTEALIIENRTMVPLRVICEDVLSKVVGFNNGVITVSSKALKLNNETVNEIKSKIGQVLKVSSLAELNNIIANIGGHSEQSLSPLPSPSTPSKENNISRDEVLMDHSNTNEQVKGVNEADIVKTDGEFIYVATGNSVKIFKVNNGRPELVETITMSSNLIDRGLAPSEIYIDKGRLVVLASQNNYDYWIKPIPIPMETEGITKGIMPIRPRNNYTYCGIYSISDKGKANLLREFELEGSMLSNRKKDNIVYLVVNKNLDYYPTSKEDSIPMYKDTAVSDKYNTIPLDKIMYYPERLSPNYVIVAAIDIMDTSQPANIEALLGSGTQIYMSNNALYIAAQDYRTIWGSITNISKLTINGTKIGFAGGGMVDGTILNQFSMDEYDGNLRVATTNVQVDSKSAVYILDKNLNQIGSLENLAPGEQIYSVRFMEDKGYLVTFRQIDPLFVVDLSNPTSPRITGELKVPGFSNYLHPLSKDILLGIGQHVDEATGRQRGIKLSIFDVSNEGKPRELSNLILGSSGSYAEVLNNHKALMLNLDDNMIAFDASLSKAIEQYQTSYFSGAVVVQVKTDGTIKLLKEISNEGNYGSVKRLLYIGDVLYYILDGQVRAFDINSFNEIK